MESKNCWPRSQGGDKNLAEDPEEQSKNRKMHRQAWKVIKTKFGLNTQKVSYPLGRLRKGNLCLQSLWQKPLLLIAHREDKRRGWRCPGWTERSSATPKSQLCGRFAPEQQGGQPSSLPATPVTSWSPTHPPSSSDLGFFLNFYFIESQNSRVVWKGP